MKSVGLCLSLLLPLPAVAQDRFVVDGTTYEVDNGKGYRITNSGRSFLADLYDPAHVANSYAFVDGTAYRIDPSTDARYRTITELSDGFEVAGLLDLVGPGKGWTGFTLQSPAAPTVPDYVRLRHDILSDGAGCIDNCLSVVPSAHTGRSALEAVAVQPTRRMQVSKAALENGLLFARQGDVITFSGWFYVADDYPVSLVDFEASYILEGPGIRVMVTREGAPWVELKWAGKPGWRSALAVTLPKRTWFKLDFEVLLHRTDGTVRLALDDQQIIQGQGQTLPLADAVIDRMEVGITATTGSKTRLLVDDVQFQMLGAP